MFERITGSFSAADSEGITADLSGISTDELKGWRCTTIISGAYTEFEITSNSQTKIFFTNALSGTGTFIIDYITRKLLETFESDMISVGKVPDELINKKIEVSKKHIREKIKLQFRYLFSEYPDDDDPLDRIQNLREIQTIFCYFTISEIYADLMLEEGDANDAKSRRYSSKYREILKESLALLAVNVDDDSELSNEEKAEAQNTGSILFR